MEYKHISATELSQGTGITRSTIYAYLQGRTAPSIDRINILAKYLNVNPQWLRGYNAPIQEELEQKVTEETIYIIANTMRDDFILHAATADKELARIVYTQLKEDYRGTNYEDDLHVLEYTHEITLGLLNGRFKHSADDPRRNNLKKPYPNNLLQALADNSPEIENLLATPITIDIERGLEHALSTLLDSEQELLRLLYQEGKPLREISNLWECTHQNVSALKQRAFAKLLSEPCIRYIQHGKEGYATLLAEQEKQAAPADDKASILIEDLNLTTLSLNALTKKGYKTVADLVPLTKKEISLIRKLGNRSICDVAQALENIGVCHTAWSEFLHKDS